MEDGRSSHPDPLEYPLYPADGTLEEYIGGLPRFEEKTFAGHIKDRISTGQKVTILDIGCGKGIALCQLVQRFPTIKASGLSLYDYRDLLDDPYLTYIKRVNYQVGDTQSIGEIFNGSQFDFIVSWYAFPYFPNPLSVLEQTHHLLSANGLAFIDGVKASNDELYRLNRLWQPRGIELYYPEARSKTGALEYRSIVMQKKAA